MFWVLAAVLLTGPAVTAISYGFPSGVQSSNGQQIDEDGKKDKEKKQEKKEEKEKKKWEKKEKKKDAGEGSGSEGSSDNSEGDGSDSGDSGSYDAAEDGSSDSGNAGSESGSGDDSAGDDSSGEEGDGGSEESTGEENSEETEEVEDEVGEEEVVEEPVEEAVEEYVEELVEEEYPEGTFPDSYFADRPMEKLQLQKYHITDPEGNRMMNIKEGEEVGMNYSLRNIQQKEQTYVMIAQIIDQHGVTIDMGWYVDTIQSGEYADWYGFWTPDAPGSCVIKIMIWDGIGENPAPLSNITEMTVLVQPASP